MGGRVLVEPAVLDLQNLLNDVPGAAQAPGTGRDILGDGLDIVSGVRRANRKPGKLHDRQIRNIIAHINDLVRMQVMFPEEGLKGLCLVFDGQVNVRDSQPLEAKPYALGPGTRDYRDGVSPLDGELQGVTVLDIERSELFTAFGHMDCSVRKDTVHIENKCADIMKFSQEHSREV